MEKFITILACVFGTLSFIFMSLRIIGYLTYTELDETLDKLKGFKREFPIVYPGIVFIICFCWIITKFI